MDDYVPAPLLQHVELRDVLLIHFGVKLIKITRVLVVIQPQVMLLADELIDVDSEVIELTPQLISLRLRVGPDIDLLFDHPLLNFSNLCLEFAYLIHARLHSNVRRVQVVFDPGDLLLDAHNEVSDIDETGLMFVDFLL